MLFSEASRAYSCTKFRLQNRSVFLADCSETTLSFGMICVFLFHVFVSTRRTLRNGLTLRCPCAGAFERPALGSRRFLLPVGQDSGPHRNPFSFPFSSQGGGFSERMKARRTLPARGFHRRGQAAQEIHKKHHNLNLSIWELLPSSVAFFLPLVSSYL